MRIDAIEPQIERKRGSTDTARQIEHGFIMPVSYTHLDVYKRQVRAGAG